MVFSLSNAINISVEVAGRGDWEKPTENSIINMNRIANFLISFFEETQK
jgi:hypothetical protein